MMKLWIYENHICELRSEELFEGRSSQLYMQLMQLRKESLKNSGLYRFRTNKHSLFDYLRNLFACYGSKPRSHFARNLHKFGVALSEELKVNQWIVN